MTYPTPSPELRGKILEYWHISRTALAGGDHPPKRWERLQYVKKHLMESNLEMIKSYSPKQLNFLIEDETTPIR